MTIDDGKLEFLQYLEIERSRVDSVLAALSERETGKLSCDLREPISYALAGGGKRLRPILCVAAYSAVRSARGDAGVPDTALYEVGCAVEWIHTYSLVHDDLPCMDNDDVRRGRAAVHRAFDVGHATAAAFAMIPQACRLLDNAARSLGLSGETSMEMVGELCRAAGVQGMVGGQVRDLEAEGRLDVGLQELEQIHALKTGALITAALRIGGMAAGASDKMLDALSRFGRKVGLAFQIADDVLDVTGDSALLGKTAGRDDELCKATFPMLLGLDGARNRAEQEVREALSALEEAGLAAHELRGLARFAVERDH